MLFNCIQTNGHCLDFSVSVPAHYCIPQCVTLIAYWGFGGGVRVGSGVHDSYTFPMQIDGIF